MNAIAMSAGTAKTEGLGPQDASAGRQASPTTSFIDHITSNQEAPVTAMIDQLWADHNERHAWLFEAGDKIRLMNEREEQGLCIKCGGQQYHCECFLEGDY